MEKYDGNEIRYKGVRKRKWGKYVAEIWSGKRSRISLGLTSLLFLRGADATSFSFPDSKFNTTTLDVVNAQGNISADVIRTTAITVGLRFNIDEAGPSTTAGASVEVKQGEASNQTREAEKDTEESDLKYLLESPKHITFEESMQLPTFQPNLSDNQSDPFPHSHTSIVMPKPAA